ncbi:UNVERIFIED_CONTAM: E3 ubiquitin-protein ligase FANCL [Sesamum angustifolium]|uniref:E3 ubiquitin-protein ligase FANCL n=1 Tax=Sesamum angustifolium TaxID=2727405 RepID=A0AAW2NLB9_9LAMI
MDVSKEFADQSRCEQLMPTSFSRKIYSEVEEVGWEHLVKMGENLTFLSFRVMDTKGRVHILEITLDETYPRCPPSVSADVPYNFGLEWSSHSTLRDVVQQFQKHVDKLHDFWSTLDDIDRSFWFQSGRCRFLGSDTTVNFLSDIWKRNCKRWAKDKSFPENLARVFDTQLTQPPHVQKNEEQVECGICYAQYLPIDDELGAKSGSATDYTCENGNCNRAFHSVCLGDWLRSITTTRQSFDVLFGNCPYCSDPIAVKISTKT